MLLTSGGGAERCKLQRDPFRDREAADDPMSTPC
jgi:hypothetical protein